MSAPDGSREQVTEVAEPAVEANRLPTRELAPVAGLALQLQRSAGNRAVTHAVAQRRLDPAGRRVLARVPVQIRGHESEPMVGGGTFGGPTRYEIELVGNEALLNVKVRLVPAAGVTPADVAAVQARAQATFVAMWDNRFIFTDQASGDAFFLRVSVTFVTRGEHRRVQLRSGSGGTDEARWFTGDSGTDFAHELTHGLGMMDEYVDPRATRRRRATSPGVFRDHSLMGNYPTEGAADAEVKLRHGQKVADDVGRALRPRRRFTASFTGTAQGERLVRWRAIRDALPAGSTDRASAAAEVTAIERDMLIPEISAAAGVPYVPTP